MKDNHDCILEDELQAERRRFEVFRQSAEIERKHIDARRELLEQENQNFRAKLVQSRHLIDTDGIILELQEENHQLVERCRRLEEAAEEANAAACSSEALEAHFFELDEVKKRLRQLIDEREREKNEYESELIALRSRLASESLEREEAAAQQESAEAIRGSAIEADERIRAFREHLRELHRKEAEQRASHSLSARLSRLWRSTGPG